MATLRLTLLICFWCFFQRREAFTLPFSGRRLRLSFLESRFCLALAFAWNLGASINSPLELATADLQPKSRPMAPTPVSLTGLHLTVIEAYQSRPSQKIVQVVGFPQLRACPRIRIFKPKSLSSR